MNAPGRSLLALLLSTGAVVSQITYLDATAGNTAAYDSSTWPGTSWLVDSGGGGTSGDHLWSRRYPFGNGSPTRQVIASSAENSPLLVTTISGLAPHALYNVYVYFWDTSDSGNHWPLKASIDPADIDDAGTAGNLADDFLPDRASVSFSPHGATGATGATGTTRAAVSSAGDFAAPVPLLVESPRTLYQCDLGQMPADAVGEIRVFIDDLPPAASSTRSWFDGVGYQLVAEAKARPNVVVIVSDDQGWADIGYNNPNVYTPNLDALANNGALLANHYSMSQCTPTRVAVMTGRYPSRWGRQGQAANNAQAYPHEILTMASMLDAMGYDSHMSGKWHMGSAPEWGPLHHGFDHAHGSTTGAVGMYEHRYRPGNTWEINWHRDHEIIPGYENGTHATDLTAREAVRFIQQERDGPFFLYLPFHAPHTPLDERGPFVDTPTQLDPADNTRWLNEDQISWFNDPLGKIQSEPDSEKRLLLATVNHLDDGIGRVVRTLEETGQRHNTIIFFSSDNGPQINWSGNAYPDDLNLTNFNQPDNLRGSKTDVWEGGIHVPGFINWPARISPRTVTEPVHVIDWVPTLAALTGYQPAGNPQWDGADLSPLLFDNGTLGTRVLYWLWSTSSNRWAVRQGDWKIVRYGTEPTASTDWQLFNLAADPTESTNLAATNPAKRDEMHAVFLAQRASDFTGNMVSPRLTAGGPVTGPFTVNAAFTASVTGLEPGDFEVVNGTSSNLSGSGAAYTIDITPTITNSGPITIRLPAGAAAGTAAPSVPSNTLEVEFVTGISNPITPFNRGVAGQESAAGAGYILYSSESVHTRFAATAPHMYNADHFIGVRNNAGTWQYDTNTAYAAFTPVAGDVLVASVDFTADTVTMLAGTDTTTNGIVTGYQSGDFNVLPNRWNGGTNTNEFDLEGSYLILNDGSQLGMVPPPPSATLFAPWATSADPIRVAIEFSEPVTGLSLGDFTITNSLNAVLGGSGASYQLEITPDSPGLVSVDLAPGAVNEGPITSEGTITHWKDYYLWANALQAQSADPSHRDPGGNVDGDLRSNFEEYVFGGNPELADWVNTGASIVLSGATGDLADFQVPIRDAAAAGGADIMLEYGDDLSRWFEPGQDLSGVTNPPPAISVGLPAVTPFAADPVWGDVSLHSFPVSPNPPGTPADRLFFRLRAQ